jgi:hypothetical protein
LTLDREITHPSASARKKRTSSEGDHGVWPKLLEPPHVELVDEPAAGFAAPVGGSGERESLELGTAVAGTTACGWRWSLVVAMLACVVVRAARAASIGLSLRSEYDRPPDRQYRVKK